MGLGKKELYNRRKSRNRYHLKASNFDRLRLTVFRSNRHISVQIIDDSKGVTLASASSYEKDFGDKFGNNIPAASKVGEEIAKRAIKAGVEKCYFDRGGYKYHGRVKALAEAARSNGLNL